jgi:site-specific recombinase XerD
MPINDYRSDAPDILCDFLSYHETVRGHSQKTVDEYYLDLRMMFRYLKQRKGLVPDDLPFDEIPIRDVDVDFFTTITLNDIYDYLSYLSRERNLNAASRARKVSTIRSFFKFMTNKTHQLSFNPVEDLDPPKIMKALPKYLSLDESVQLLQSVQGRYQVRDYCILMLFLNCGIRISELVALNLSDIHDDHIRVLGKGNKERILFLNDACKSAINDYLPFRSSLHPLDAKALFISSQRTRISRSAVHLLVKKHLGEAGLDSTQYSAHKLRHTAATLMLQNGVDVRTLQEILGHDHLNTTQIYTHVDSTDLRIAAQANPLSHMKKQSKKKQDDA